LRALLPGQLGFRTPPAQQRKCFVVRDPEQPAREAGGVVQFGQALVGFQEHFLAHIHGVFTIRDQPEKIVKDTLLPSGNQEVIGLHVPAPRFGDQVWIFDFPEDQLLAPFIETPQGLKKSDQGLLI
jgi:hypothetical protein